MDWINNESQSEVKTGKKKNTKLSTWIITQRQASPTDMETKIPCIEDKIEEIDSFVNNVKSKIKFRHKYPQNLVPCEKTKSRNNKNRGKTKRSGQKRKSIFLNHRKKVLLPKE